jgi:hypothetical protein
MRKKSDTVRYTAKQIKARIAKGDDRTNWSKTDAVTSAKLEASIRADTDDVRGEPDWTQAIVGIPAPKTISTSASITMFWNGSGRTERGIKPS